MNVTKKTPRAEIKIGLGSAPLSSKPNGFGVSQATNSNETWIDSSVSEGKMLRLKPFALQMSPDDRTPLLLLRDEEQTQVLPVSLSPIEAGVTIAQSNPSLAPVSPHKASASILQTFGLKVAGCVFSEIRSQQQWVTLQVESDFGLRQISVRAAEAMSFCLFSEVPIWGSAQYAARSRGLVQELQGALADWESRQNHHLERQHKYIL